MRYFIPDAALIGNGFIVETLVDAVNTFIPVNVNAVTTCGYNTIGDEGGANYRKVALEPAHAGKFQSADGSWWELFLDVVTPQMFGALGDNTGNQIAALDNAIAYLDSKGGGELTLPSNSIFRITTRWTISVSNINLTGRGKIHAVNSTRLSALYVQGTALAIVENVHIKDITVYGDVTQFINRIPSDFLGALLDNGDGIIFEYCSHSDAIGVNCHGFSDGGIFAYNSDYTAILKCNVYLVSQGVGVLANAVNSDHCSAINNNIYDIGQYNGLHTEGSFGDGLGDGEIRWGTFTNNRISNCSWNGINIELSPYSNVSNNIVYNSGLAGGVDTNEYNGIKLFGSYRSVVGDNLVTGATAYCIAILANCGLTSVEGNMTFSGVLGDLLLSDLGTAVTLNVALGINAFEGPTVVYSGNVSVRQPIPNLRFMNRADTNANTLDYFEKAGTFVPVARGSTIAGAGTYTTQLAEYTRIGDICFCTVQIGWSAHTGTGFLSIGDLPFAASNVLQQCVPIWVQNLAFNTNNVLLASIAQGGLTVNIQQYADASGNTQGVDMDAAVDSIVLTFMYKVAV